MITMKQIDEINKKLKDPNLDESLRKVLMNQKLDLIAYLYQALEWVHPFPDGQGRTDLVVLSKLLCEEGFNPPILDDPYISTFAPFSEWRDYLANGIELWKKEKALH